MFEKKNFVILLIIFSSLLLLFNFWGMQKKVEATILLLTSPINSAAFNSSRSVKDFLGVFEEVRILRGEYYDLQEKYLELKAKENLKSLLIEENLTLKEQLGVEDDVDVEDLVLAEVLYQDIVLKDESLLVNKGEEDGLKIGDVAVVGGMYVGIVNEIFQNTAKIRLPTSRASSLKVMILDQEIIQEEESFEPKNYLSGVAVGHTNVLYVENIETRGELEEGYTVLINDSKIGKHLYLGNVLTVGEDPTATMRTCSIELPIDYSNLKRVFIKKGG